MFEKQFSAEPGLPVQFTRLTGRLTAFGRVLMELDVHAIGGFDPDLPAMVVAEFLLADGPVARLDLSNHAVDVIRLEAQVANGASLWGIESDPKTSMYVRPPALR